MKTQHIVGLDTSEEMPRDSYELIDKLDEAFPHQCIGRNESEIAAHRYAGRRALIDWLINWREEDRQRSIANAYTS